MLKKIESSTLFLLAGIGLFGYGAFKFWELAIIPHLSRFVGGTGDGGED